MLKWTGNSITVTELQHCWLKFNVILVKITKAEGRQNTCVTLENVLVYTCSFLDFAMLLVWCVWHFKNKKKMFREKKSLLSPFIMGLLSNCGPATEIFSFRKMEIPQEYIEKKSRSAAPLSSARSWRKAVCSPRCASAQWLSKPETGEPGQLSAWSDRSYLIGWLVQLSCDRQLCPVSVCRAGWGSGLTCHRELAQTVQCGDKWSCFGQVFAPLNQL